MTDLTVHPKEKDQVYRREAAAVDEDATRVVGTTQLYREDGRIRLIPVRRKRLGTWSPDYGYEGNPLNLPVWRKRFAVSALGEKTVGALALSAEVVIGGLIPIFILEYAGVDPRSIRAAALSPSLGSHLAARAVQGLGAGAVEALIPLVLQDMFFLHERNTWMSTIVSSQGVIIIALGIASPYIAANHSWRWIYRVTTGFGAVAWALLLLFLPEARWARSKEELNRFFVRLEPMGHNVYDIAPDEDRPQLDTARFRARSAWDDVGVFNCGFDWREAGVSMLDTLRTTFLPVAATQVLSFTLLAQGWRFELTGLGVLPFVAAALFVYVFAGPVADRVSMSVTRRRSRGGKVDGDANNSNSNSNKNNNAMAREAEDNLPNFILPFALGIAGAFLFGAAAQQRMHWAVLLLASFLVIFAYLTVLTLGNVLVVESYPVWAGPVLVNVGSMRITVAFFLASRAVEWVQAAGPLATFAMYGEALLVIALGIPALFFCGKRLRAWTAGRVGVVGAAGGGRSGDGEAGVV
ncbi:hypothetical protein GGTG_02101 [Gaeumannomyces tritici R3-111a-1]|uniref:Major facilitator superfamily (MFS) profile domain-containing protein n=1 Tax=Gaeumannomyces tritici (strain R3-111a-1) TaxID=644352 RepID=J3NLF2_GAET3|nr:hypothetical protein GGTG_02101 [Gaeumannomyces tritici R3-111a-1]EJT82127.1 hypothetical protein GGTG_02101 [Gaeumannomyces tritici R3-111a-1]